MPLDVSVQQTVFPTAACAAIGLVLSREPMLPLDMSVLKQPMLPLAMSFLQQTVLPRGVLHLDVSACLQEPFALPGLTSPAVLYVYGLQILFVC